MKKIKLLILFFILMFPVMVDAYGIENYYVDATIEKDGSILVQEYFNLTGQFNGMERIIKYANNDAYEFDPTMTSFGGSSIHNGSDLEILEVRAVPIDSNFLFNNIGGTLFNRTSSAEKGDYGVYKESLAISGKSLLIYNPSSYNQAFYIKYRINNIAIKHNDVAEIGWNVIGNELSETIGNFKLSLHIPGNTNVRAWAHGPLNGKVNIVDSENVLFTISNVSSYRAIDVRATFDLNVINESSKYTNTNALDKIILYETDKAEQANYERQNKEKVIINDATYYTNQFIINTTRDNYKLAIESVNKISDSNLRDEYLQKISMSKKELDKEEEKIARDVVKWALKNPEYVWYKDAQEKVRVLDNMDVKLELFEKLLVVEETIKKDELNKEKKNYFFGGLLIFIVVILGHYVYRTYRKDPKVEFNQLYLRDIPSDCSPEVVSYLFHKKIIDNSLAASLLDLIQRKVIIVEKLKRNNYKLILNESNDNMVTYIESKILDLIFHSNQSIETKELKKYAERNYDSYISKWDSYQNTALNTSKNKLFYKSDIKTNSKSIESNSVWLIILFIIMFLMMFFPIMMLFILILYLIAVLGYYAYKYIKLYFSNPNSDHKKTIITILYLGFIGVSIYMMIVINVFQHYYKNSVYMYLCSMILSVIFLIILYNKKQRTESGALEYKKWKAFKNFLNDFGRFHDKEVSEVTLWEKYLVYATLFGCSKKILKSMKVEFQNIPNNILDNDIDLYFVSRSVTNSIRSSYGTAKSARSIANASSGSSSSGSGGGGGFSSGGGSFGGGGGGGRF